jgi:hypothetical protein
MVADFVVQRAQSEINQRRRAVHQLQNTFAANDYFLHFKPEPAAFVIAQNFVCRQIKFKNFSCSVARRLRKSFPQEIGKYSKEKYYKHWETCD